MVTTINISGEGILAITDQIKQFGTTETGGVLMGTVKGDQIMIEKVSGPGPNAIHYDIYFRADANYIDMFIDQEYARSNGKCIYLGEWHTHPQITPYPSEVDLESLDEISADSENFAVLVIIGAVDFTVRDFNDHLIAVVKYKNDNTFYRLRLVETSFYDSFN